MPILQNVSVLMLDYYLIIKIQEYLSQYLAPKLPILTCLLELLSPFRVVSHPIDVLCMLLTRRRCRLFRDLFFRFSCTNQYTLLHFFGYIIRDRAFHPQKINPCMFH